MWNGTVFLFDHHDKALKKAAQKNTAFKKNVDERSVLKVNALKTDKKVPLALSLIF